MRVRGTRLPGARHFRIATNNAAGAVMIGAQIRYGHLRGWDWLDTWGVTPRAIGIALALTAIVLSPGFNPAFIYFQF